MHRIIMAVVIIVSGAVGAAHAAKPPREDSETNTLKGGILSDPLWELDIPRQDLEPIILGFVQAYEGGDIDRFMRAFAPQVKTDSGVRSAREVREEYAELFLGTTQRHIIIRNIRWAHIDTRVQAEADLLTSMISRRDDQRRQNKGAVRFYLTKAGVGWRISEMYFADDPAE